MPTATRSSPDVRQSAQPKSVWYERLTKAAAYSLPEIPIILAALIYTQAPVMQRSVGVIAFYYPYAMFGAGLLLGWRFHRSRLLFALLVLALVDRSLLAFVASHGFTRDHVAFQAIAFLLPLNLAALSLTAERGVFTAPGLVRLGIILGQVALVAILQRGAPGAAAALLHARLLPPSWFAWTPLADPALLAFLVAAGLMGAGHPLSPTSTGRSFCWSLLPAFLGLSAARAGNAGFSTFYFATSALILIIAVVEASYHMAYQDSLTALPARRALNEALLRLGSQYPIGMVDVDHFKRINDNHGHDVGDQGLKKVAAKLPPGRGGGRAYPHGRGTVARLFSRRSGEGRGGEEG